MNKQEFSEEGLASIEEACDFLTIGRTTLYAMVKRGELSYVKLGRRKMIPRKVLRDLVNDNTVLEKP